MGAGTVGHVVVDGHGEGVGLLEDHTDTLAQIGDILAGGVDILSPVQQGAVDLHNGNKVVHPIETAQEGGLAAAGRTNERGDLVLRDLDVDILQRVVFSVIQVEVFGL